MAVNRAGCRPVIAAGPLERAIVEAEAETADQMESGAGGGAEPGDVAGVRRNLRFPKRDVQHRDEVNEDLGLAKQP